MEKFHVFGILYGPMRNPENMESLLGMGKSIRNPLLETMNITWLQDAYVNAKK